MSRVDEPLNPTEAHELQPWVAHFMMKNEGWKRIYESAPRGAKASLEYSFDSAYCAYTGKKRSLEEIKEIALKNPVKHTKEDWNYLIKIFPNSPARPYYEKRLAEAKE